MTSRCAGRRSRVGRPRLGGIADKLAVDIQQRTGKECRALVLGHLQRGGMPTGYDRLLAARFGGAAVRAVAAAKWGHMVALQSPDIVEIPIAEALREPKRVDPQPRRGGHGAGDGDRLRGLNGAACGVVLFEVGGVA